MNLWSATPTLRSNSILQAKEFDGVRPFRTLRPLKAWNPEKFAQTQIRGLVRNVFLSREGVRQIVLSAVDPETDVRSVCRCIGETLASEKVGNVAVVEGGHRHARGKAASSGASDDPNDPRSYAACIAENLWLVAGQGADASTPREQLLTRLSMLRRDFEYSILEVAPAGYSDEAIASAHAADGVILVLSARHTRRATARTVKEMFELANVRMLGAVLSDRTFPIPEKIYQRL